jgi:Ca2+-binding RTX toxin-like protein
MAKLVVTVEQPDNVLPFLEFESPELRRHSGDSATYSTGNANVVFKGSNLVYDGGQIIGGTITSVVMKLSDGTKLCEISGLKFSGRNVVEISEPRFVYSTSLEMLNGQDTIVGSTDDDRLLGGIGNDAINGKAGSDVIMGQAGNDTLTGGGGADSFLFFGGDGRDIITDFQFRGATLDTIDMIDATSYELRDTRKGLLVDFDTDDSVLIRGAKEATFDTSLIS